MRNRLYNVLRALTRRTCTWTFDLWDYDCVHQTRCGQMFQLTEPGPLAEQGFRFCVYCGLPIREVRINRYAEEDE